jgi:hypothetical protein
MGRECDSDESSTDSSANEDATNIIVNKGLLFPNVGHKCLIAKDSKNKKVIMLFDDEGSSSGNDDLTSLFANLTKEQNKKINELIEIINEKDESLECKRTCSLRRIKNLLR